LKYVKILGCMPAYADAVRCDASVRASVTVRRKLDIDVAPRHGALKLCTK
jgi:hypothetical protein